jgi:Ca2+-binding EF-hand superfamily protein
MDFKTGIHHRLVAISTCVLLSAATAAIADVNSDFGILDKDEDERISRAELKSFPRLRQLFDAADLDGNGVLNQEEFRKLVSIPGGQALPE